MSKRRVTSLFLLLGIAGFGFACSRLLDIENVTYGPDSDGGSPGTSQDAQGTPGNPPDASSDARAPDFTFSDAFERNSGPQGAWTSLYPTSGDGLTIDRSSFAFDAGASLRASLPSSGTEGAQAGLRLYVGQVSALSLDLEMKLDLNAGRHTNVVTLDFTRAATENDLTFLVDENRPVLRLWMDDDFTDIPFGSNEWQKFQIDLSVEGTGVAVKVLVNGDERVSKTAHKLALPDDLNLYVGINYSKGGPDVTAWFDDVHVKAWR